MRENGQDQMMTLMRMDDPSSSLRNLDPEVGSLASANLSALAVDWMGFIELIRNPVFRETLKGLPISQEDESTAEYITRIWPLLTDNERGAALDLGLQKMTTLGHISRTGIQVRVWKAFRSGEWQHSPMGENDFRPWVRSVLTDSLSYSAGESSKLATLCEVIGYLGDNFRFEFGIPEDLESCFRRPFYWRWKTVAPKILQIILGLEEETDKIEIRAFETDIGELVEAVYNEDLTPEDIAQQGRKSAPRLKPIIFLENRWLANVHTGTYEMTDTQLSYLRKKLGNTLDYRLEGEVYAVDQWFMQQYRNSTTEVCTICGAVDSRCVETGECIQCNAYDSFKIVEEWHIRTFLRDKDEWAIWVLLAEEPRDKGIFESELSDQDMGLEYSTYWVKDDN